MRFSRFQNWPGLTALLLVTGAILLSGTPLAQAQSVPTTEDRWEPNIRKFEAADKQHPPVTGGNLFIGSSSIVRWPIATSFPDLPCVNRGFGGSRLPDVLKHMDRLIPPHQPAVIVLYCGDNDLAGGRTPEQVRDDYQTFVSKARKIVPEAKIVWIAIKPSGKRWKLRDQIQQANALVKDAQQGDDRQVFVDVWEPMLAADGTPQPELFVADQLHMSAAGYAIWNKLVRPHLVTAPQPAAPSSPKAQSSTKSEPAPKSTSAP